MVRKRIDISDNQLWGKISQLAQKCGYSTEIGNNFFIENTLHIPAFESGVFDVNAPPSNSDFFDKYFMRFGDVSFGVGYSKCLELAKELALEITPITFDRFIKAIFFCPTPKLKELFRNAIEPIFFGVFPKGKIICVVSSAEYYYRQAFQRVLYTLSQYPSAISDLQGNFKGFNALKDWIGIDPHELLETILMIVGYAFCPYVGHIVGSHTLGLKILFLPDEAIKYEPDPFPESWIDIPKTKADFAKEIHTDFNNPPQRMIHGKYVFDSPLPFDERIAFAEWGIRQADTLVRFLCDVTNFTQENNPDVIDPIYCIEYGYTIAHLLSICLSILGNRGHYHNKSSLFLIADILGSLAKVGDMHISNEAEFMKELFRKDIGGNKMVSILSRSNIGPLQIYSSVIDKIYSSFHNTLINSMWYSPKKSSGGITVKDASLSKETILSENEFVGEIIRVLRNTHHG
ncbi:MAG TPA: hypothetical protein VMW42_10195, partial [Desulfatiglandales bacterium]|nr:hypothetical protein [Desulfatiglandales bacterium]